MPLLGRTAWGSVSREGKSHDATASHAAHGGTTVSSNSFSLIDKKRLDELDHARHRELPTQAVTLAHVSEGISTPMILGGALFAFLLLAAVVWKTGVFGRFRIGRKLAAGFGCVLALTVD